ncbi:superoxide dismutase [Candidatus Aerophobetes bacterium]|uniref:superoxide dismutase n=1 Tax=Aerophobetes bacterium TaxID=2030807 RepID=A0A2A4YG45_UNCAE|nr:MAG: superoxide dismutase [Candidatus Aerophobetes bacterium]
MYKAKDFSHLLGGKLKGLSDSLLEMHFTLYKGYVKNTNNLIKALEDMKQNDQGRTLAFGALKRRFGWEYDGMRLHELYFGNLGKKVELSPKSDLYKQIVRDFGSYEKWRRDYLSTGLIRGIGWVILYRDPIQGHLFNVWVNEHDLGHLAGGMPLLVMDVWEHAYITEYGLDRAKYIDMFMYNIDWKVIERRYKDSSCFSKYTVDAKDIEKKSAI